MMVKHQCLASLSSSKVQLQVPVSLATFKMMASQVFTGALLFAMLFVHVCCVPVKSGSFNPGPSYGGGRFSVTPTYSSDEGGPVTSEGASEKGYAPSVVQGPSASIVGYSGSAAAGPSPGSTVVSGTGFQQGPQDVNWAIQPLSFLSGTDGHTSDAAHVSYGPAYHGPTYQGGDLSGYEGSYEHGDAMGEMGGHSYVAPSTMLQGAAMQYTSNLQSGSDMTGTWGVHPLYDYMFMTGQYPPGTITHSASSYEQGRDNFADVHYQRYYIPQYTVQEIQVQVPQTVQAAPVKGKGKGY